MRWAWRLAPVLQVLVVVLGASCRATAQAEPARTYVAIGASDSVGVGADDPVTQGWVPRFAGRLGPDVQVVNLGVSGSTLAQALDEQLGPAVDAQPSVVTVWLAVNDLNARVPLDRYAADLDTLLGQLEATHARVLVGNVPDLSGLAVYRGIDPGPLRAEVDRWNAAIAASAAKHGAVLVDLFGPVGREVADHPEYVSPDGFHPSSGGYQRLADVFGQALTDAEARANARP
ncbi:MAG: SGNH/GDSL hydrolase family protein [Chloroflexota bacterium]|nr:SGNH/GDSL hydrolase family protein [Chloroflexota bacterium]